MPPPQFKDQPLPTPSPQCLPASLGSSLLLPVEVVGWTKQRWRGREREIVHLEGRDPVFLGWGNVERGVGSRQKGPQRERHRPFCSRSTRGRLLPCSATPGLSQATHLPFLLTSPGNKESGIREGAPASSSSPLQRVSTDAKAVPQVPSQPWAADPGTTAATVLFFL